MSANSPTSNRKTVFIIGAGASNEAGLPTGYELKESIANVLNFEFEMGYRQIRGDDRIVDALRVSVLKPGTINRDISAIAHFLKAARQIHNAMPQASSIDNFINSHSGNKEIELCGKLAIVRTILEAEAKSHLFVGFEGNQRLRFDRLDGTWFQSFLHMITDNCRSSDLAERLGSITLIIFNYDRCIEQYLYYAIQNYYEMSESDVAQLLRGLEIYHPYGTVGTLPWLSHAPPIAYGAKPNSNQLLNLATQIRTYTESIDEAEINSVRSQMQTSPTLVFLGFAFHHLNMDLLLPPFATEQATLGRHIFATAHRISDSNTKAISAELEDRTGIIDRNIHVRNTLTCSLLFKEYSRSLSFRK